MLLCKIRQDRLEHWPVMKTLAFGNWKAPNKGD